MRLTFLGTGTSYGVPVIGCRCRICSSPDPRNNRCRPSALVEVRGTTLLIDAGPELRMQSIRFGVAGIDAVLLTHAHADHIFGLDDLRAFNVIAGRALDVFASPETCGEIRRRFDYVFKETQAGGGKPQLVLRETVGRFAFRGVEILPVPVMHGSLPVLAFRIGGLAYVTDANLIPPGSMRMLEGLDVLIIGALRPRPHPTHMNIAQATEISRLLAPARTYFTHLTHDVEHAEMEASLPAGIRPAYDGLVIECGDPPAG
ncbi:MAG TPA: MBL fold metallo-hydrolase [Candidatus Brocadiia bacterium]|nr:MBL fold metallo-hydrolase [Candidatus Brocadiia bacterium]